MVRSVRMSSTLAGLLLSVLLGVATGQVQESVVPLPSAHAHNDYRHDRPLHDALAHGFCSVEADIFLVEGQLLVAHSRFELKRERTLEKLYLDPLKERVEQNGGRVFSDGPPFMLLVDIKTDGENVYKALRETLLKYESMLSGIHDGQFEERAIQIVISGDRPRQSIIEDVHRLVGIDGRVGDLGANESADLLPLISDRWSTHFRWRGVGEFPDDERDKLNDIVQRAHEENRRVRFWATPEAPELWRELQEAGVDHINTDRLERLQQFLLEQVAEPDGLR